MVIKLAILSGVLLIAADFMVLLTGWMLSWMFGRVDQSEDGVDKGFDNDGQKPKDAEVFDYDADCGHTASPTSSMSPSRVHRRGRRRGVGEVSHYAKMHSRTRYRI